MRDKEHHFCAHLFPCYNRMLSCPPRARQRTAQTTECERSQTKRLTAQCTRRPRLRALSLPTTAHTVAEERLKSGKWNRFLAGSHTFLAMDSFWNPVQNPSPIPSPVIIRIPRSRDSKRFAKRRGHVLQIFEIGNRSPGKKKYSLAQKICGLKLGPLHSFTLAAKRK